MAILAVATMASFLVVFGQNNKVQAATSSTINFQARLLTAAGAVVPDGQYNVEFKLYTALTSSGSSQGSCTGDANCVWVETRTSGNTVRVVDGYLTVNLGSVNAFSSINWDQQLYLSMNIGGTSVTPSWDGEMSPRLLLTAVPYAFRAGTLIGGTGANTTTLDTGTPSGNNTIHLPAASGTVCLQSSTACGFAMSSGSGSYIQNGTSLQTGANFAIQSAATGLVGGLIQGANGQTADLFDAQTWNGTTATTVFSISNTGDIGTQNINVAANKSITLAAGTGTFTQTLSTATNLGYGQSLTFNNTNSGSSNVAIYGEQISVSAQTGGAGANSVSVFRFVNPTGTGGGNTFNALDFAGTGYTNVLKVNGNAIINGSGLLQNAGLDSTQTYSNLTKVGALNVGSIATGFGTITTANSIQGSTGTFTGANSLTLGTTGTSTGAILFNGATAASGTITLIAPTSPTTNTITLPNATGTICLQSSSACGFATGTAASYIQNGTTVQTNANFNIRSAATGSVTGVLQGASGQTADLFDAQTWNGTSATNVFSVNNVGAITLNGTGTTNFTTPQGSSVATKINVPVYDPGAFGQIIAMGLPSSANATARVLSLLDARTTTHQPTIAVFNPGESDAIGFSWNGTNNLANVQTIDIGSGSTDGVMVRSGNVTSGNGGSGILYLESGSVAGGAGGYASGNVILQSGSAAGTTANSGNVQIDVGTATGTKGSILIGTTNAPTITLGNSAAATNTAINMYGSTLLKTPNNSATAFQVQSSGSTTPTFDVDTSNGRIGVGTNAPSRTIDAEFNNTNINALPLLLHQGGTGDTGIDLQTTSQEFFMGIDASDSKLKISSAASANGTFTQGDTTQEAGNDFNSNGAQATKFTATASGTVSSESVYITSLDATPGNRLIQVGIYADSSGAPGALLGSSSATTAVVGWNTISFSGVSITSGTSYWIAMAENGANHFAVATAAGASTAYHTTSGYPLPNPFAQTTTSTDKPSFYITVANSGSSNNFGGTNLLTMSDTGQTIYKNSANTTTAFQIQNASGTGLFDADTSNGRIGIGTTAPAYTLDVAGDINIGSSNAYRIGGTSICTSAGCAPASGSSNYIQNQNAAQQASSNFWISGTGRADTGIQSPLFDTPSGTATLQLGMTNATALELGHSTFFAPGANRTFYIAAPGSGTGNNLTVQAGSGAGTNASGGSLILQGGNNTGTGTAGAVIVKPQADTANAFQVQNAAGTTNVLNVGTTNSLVTINGDINFTGLQPASTSGSGTAAANWFMTSGAGGNTTGTTGQTAGNGSTIFIAGGNGGTAPAGSTNGSGGNVYISGGTAGAGAGSAGFRGNVILQSGGGVVGVGTASPNQAYKIDAAGDINISSGSSYRINGTAICTSSGCTPASGSSYYIQNQFSTVQSANVRIQTTSDTVNTVTLQSTANQNNGSNQSDLLEFQSSTGGLMAGVTPIGTIWSAPISTLAGVPTTARMFIQANSTASNSVVIRTSALGTGVASDAGPLRVQNKDGSIDTFDINGDGSIFSRMLTDSTTAFQLQNASGVSLFNLNTTSYSATFGSSAAGGGMSSIQVQTATGSESTLSFLSGSAPSSSNIKFVLSKRSDNTSFWLYGYDNTTFVNYMKVDGVNHYINFVPDGTGAVGIGTATPSRELDVKVNNTSTNALPVIVEQGGGAGDSGIEIKNTTANYYAGIDTSDSSAFKINSYASAAGSILGFDGVSYATDTGDPNNMNASQFTAAKSGTITNLYAYVGSTSITGSGQMAIYTDNGSNAPGTKIASSASVTVTTGWNAYTISSTSVTAGTKYWLAYNAQGTSSQNNLNADWSQGNAYFVAQTFGTWPSTWTAGGTSYTGTYDLYAPITASSAPTDNWSTQLLRLSQTGALTIQNNQNSTTALQVLNDNSLSIFSVDTTNDAVRINGPNATQSGGRLYFGDLQNVYIGEYGNSDTDQLALYGNSGINMGTSAGNFALSIVNGTWNGNTIGMVGINTNTPSDPLTVNGNFTVRDSDTVTKEYRFRTTGTALDFEGSGADLYLSDWSTAGFTGTQYTAMILSHSSSRIDVKSTFTYFNPTTTSGDVIDVNRSTAGTLIGFALAGTIQGSISVSGTTVSYNAFTGSHFALTNEAIDRSMLVSMTGNNQRRDPTDMTSEPYYGITKTAKANDPAVLGSFLAPLDPSKPVSMDNPDQVMSVGNGDMWVDDEGGNINPGDYLISSNVAGYAMKDTGQFAESNIVGRASDPVDWTNETAVVNGHKVKRIEVLYTQFTRMNATGLAMGLASGGIVSNDVTFNGLVTFSKAVTFQSDVSLLGHITVGDNTAGTVDIPAGQTSVSVTFSSPYDKAPKVTTGVSDFVDVAVGNKSGKGFTIQIPSARGTDTYVDWTALATP